MADSNPRLARILTDLGLPSRSIKSRQVELQQRKLSASRVVIEDLSFMQVQATSRTKLHDALFDNRMTAALLQRLPALAVIVGDDVDHVRMPSWAFVALLQMVRTCNPNDVATVLNDYLPLGPKIPAMDLKLVSGVLSVLEETARSSSSTSATDSPSTKSETL